MKANIPFNEIANELYNIFSDDRRADSYKSDRGEMYDMFSGWAGPMSPANRPAFVNTFGQDVTDRAEAEARARVDEYRAAVAASAYHRHELEADAFAAAYGTPEKSQVPEMGAFVWCLTNGMKCENGPADPLRDFAEGGELGEFRRVLVEIVAAVDLPSAEFLTAEAAHRVAADHQETGGSRYEEADPLRLDGQPMAWTTGVLVRCGARWYVVDSEGYDWARYVLMPDNMADMYAPELSDLREAYEAREAEKAAEAQRQAASRRADYLARCARWSPLMEDVRPLVEAERAAYGGREKSQIRKASAKLSAARRRNLVAMASALYPGVKFSAKKWDGWGGSYELTWADGPTEEHLQEAGDFDLFESSRDTFSGWDDSSDVIRAEFVDFAEKYFDLGGQINFRREVSDEYRQSIADRIRAAVPGLPEGDQEPIKDNGQQSAICGMFREVGTSHLCDMLDRYGLREAVGYIARSMDATPAHQDEPTDPNGGGSPAPSYGDGEKSQLQDAPTAEGVEVVGYSAKALAVFGDTRALADELKAIGAKFNRALSYNGERRAGWIISRRKADELAAVLAVPQGQEEDGAAAPALPEPPAAVVYDPAQPIESAEFVAVDADGAPYGMPEKSQNQEADEWGRTVETQAINAALVVVPAHVMRDFGFIADSGEIVTNPGRAALLHPSRGFVVMPDDGGTPYTPAGGAEALAEILQAGGFLNFDGFRFVWPIEHDADSIRRVLAAYGETEKSQISARLEEIRAAIVDESASYEQIVYLQEHAEYIDPADTQLLEWAGVPEADGAAYGEAEKSQLPDHLADIYQRAKAKSAEAVALFHCGDWFTAYGADADRVADAVGIIITTTRDGFRKASFPFAALDTYLPRMVRQGMKVCICDAPRQAEPSRQEKVAQEV